MGALRPGVGDLPTISRVPRNDHQTVLAGTGDEARQNLCQPALSASLGCGQSKRRSDRGSEDRIAER